MKRTVLHVAFGLAAFFGTQGVQAAQSVFPAADAAGTTFTANGANSWAVTRPAGSQLVFFGRYTSGNPSESGLGLNVQYDATKITSVTIDQVVTKCMLFTPDVVVNGASSQVLFGWADTSQRGGGAVGWPGLVDGTPPCIDPPGFVTTTGALTVPTTLFRFVATTAPTLIAGQFATISISSTSASSANGAPAFTNTNLVVNGGPPAPCVLDVDGNGTKQAFVDGILLVRYMLGLTGTSLTVGLTIPGPNNTAALLLPIMNASDYDIDGSGTKQAFVDGIILVRLMLGISDASLLNGITLPASATFTTAAAIRANVNSKCGTSF